MEQSLPSLSVIVPHYGDPGATVTLCRQLRAQAYAGPFQVVVSDDASPTHMPPIEGVDVVRRDRNGGFGSAVNTGAHVANGDLLLILNSDVTLPANFLTTLVRAAQAFQPALVAPRIRYRGAAEVTGRRFPRARHQWFEAFGPFQRFHRRPWWNRFAGLEVHSLERETAAVDWIAGVAMLLPRTAFEEVGGFDEGFFMYAEEVDLQARLRKIGLPSLLVAAVTIDHVGGGSSDPTRTRAWMLDSRLRYADKWGGGLRLRAGLLGVYAANLGFGLVRRAAGREVDLSGDRTDLGRILRAPVHVQPSRQVWPARVSCRGYGMMRGPFRRLEP